MVLPTVQDSKKKTQPSDLAGGCSVTPPNAWKCIRHIFSKLFMLRKSLRLHLRPQIDARSLQIPFSDPIENPDPRLSEMGFWRLLKQKCSISGLRWSWRDFRSINNLENMCLMHFQAFGGVAEPPPARSDGCVFYFGVVHRTPSFWRTT